MKYLLSSLSLVYLLHSTEAAFAFVLQINNHTTTGSCDTFLYPNCETYFSLFCLRESRTNRLTNTGDCPLGAYRENFDQESGNISIQSSAEWKGGFQLFIQAFDSDDGFTGSDLLDDIFVEGTLRDNALSSAMTFTGVNNKVSITVQFQRTCDANNYGLSCLTHCVPADNDVEGHYTCNTTDGSIICSTGYSNPENNCRENINDCAPGPCHNGGSCTDLVAEFACACPPGYSGKNCSMDIDECQEVYCPGNSTCMDSIDAFTCVCNPGYTGQNCTEVLDPCESSPCDNGGTCVVVDPFSSMCVCPTGYTGTVCKESGNKLSAVVIGSVVGVAIILVLGCLILCVLLLTFGIRQKYKKFEKESSERNEYIPSPSKSEQLESNPLYGKADSTISSGLQSPNGSLHICENSLYTLEDIQKFQVKSSEEETQFKNGDLINEKPVSDVAITTSPNMSYESLNLTSPAKELKNPLYGKRVITPPQGTTTPLPGVSIPPPEVSMPPPVYSVPRPASDINSPLHHSSSDHNSPTNYPSYEAVTNLAIDTSNREVYYETIGDKHSHKKQLLPPLSPRITAVTPSSQDGSSSYDQLHHDVSNHPVVHQQPVRLSAADRLDYEQLEHN